MRVYTNDTDTFVARDFQDLPHVYEEHYGCSMEEMTGDDEELAQWGEVDPETVLMLTWDNREEAEGKGTFDERFDVDESDDPWSAPCLVTAQARDWAEWNGRGLLCSTEY